MDNKFVLSPSFNEVVFEKRNKKYGAYDIRRKYTRYAVLAGACAIFFFTCGSLTWAYVQSPEASRDVKITEFVLSPDPVLPKVDDPKKDEVKPEEPKQELHNAAALGPKTPDITSNLAIVEETPEVPPSNLFAGMRPDGDSAGTGVGPKMDTIVKDPVVSVAVQRVIEWSNNPPTCAELDAFLAANIRYPQMCRENGIEGTVYVQFIVDTKGDYRDVQVVKGPHPALNKEALRVMSIMPKWTPAKDDNGVLVDYLMRKPIRFQLQ